MNRHSVTAQRSLFGSRSQAGPGLRSQESWARVSGPFLDSESSPFLSNQPPRPPPAVVAEITVSKFLLNMQKKNL